MLIHPQFDPVAIHLGPLAIRWYGLMYLAGFIAFLILGRRRAASQPWHGIDGKQLDDLLFHGVLGVIIGGRLGQVLFYEPGYYLAHPLEIAAVWKGGMSFHGGFLGVLVAMWLWGRRHGRTFFEVTDFIAPLVPLGLMAGRIGNFINGELWRANACCCSSCAGGTRRSSGRSAPSRACSCSATVSSASSPNSSANPTPVSSVTHTPSAWDNG